jgi:hypothetical protein
MNEFNLQKKYNWELAHEPIVKTYKAILTQTGTSVPVATVLVNTLGEGYDIDWTYTGVGLYAATLNKGAFDATKTYIQVERGFYSSVAFTAAGVNPSATSTIVVNSKNTAGTNTNIAGTAFIEINIYG